MLTLPPRIAPDALIDLEHLASSAGSFTSQSFCGARRMRAPLAPPRLSEPRKVEAEAQAVLTSSATLSPESAILRLRLGDIRVAERASGAGIGSCQIRSSAGHFRARDSAPWAPCRDG